MPRPRPVIETFEPRRLLASVPSGFEQTTLLSGLSRPTALEVAPDGRIFFTEQNGSLRILRGNGTTTTPLRLNVDARGERGLLGVTLDPDFSSNGHIYLYYTVPSPAHNRLSRFTVINDSINAASERVLLDLPNLSGATNHNGGAIHFGADGKLYIAVGENADPAKSQSLDTPFGKMLRINRDGSIPSDNPYYSRTSGVNRAIWAIGLRNPYTFAVHPTTGQININEVGQSTWEEINVGRAGANYGWPQTEGPTTAAGITGPLYAYGRSGGVAGRAIAGGAFYEGSNFPSRYHNDYFFGDYVNNWIASYDPGSRQAWYFATGVSAPVDIDFNAAGEMIYLSYSSSSVGGSIGRIRSASAGAPVITQQPQDRTAAVGQSVSFGVGASGANLKYQWQRNGQNIGGANGPTYTLDSVSAGDNGAQFRVIVSNGAGSVTSGGARLTVTQTGNTPPVPTITTPSAGQQFVAGRSYSFSGIATDQQDGTLPASAFTWRVDYITGGVVRPFVPETSGVRSGSFLIPTDTPYLLGDVSYRVVLSVRDSQGAVTTTTRALDPTLVTVTVRSDPGGALLFLDGKETKSDFSFVGVAGVRRSIGAPATRIPPGLGRHNFVRWSDGGAITHDIFTPTSDTTYTAYYAPAGQTPPPPPPPPTGSYRINFQPGGSSTSAGYTADTGETFGSRGNGATFGWSIDRRSTARDRGATSDQKFDTLNHMQLGGNANWELALPNGSYRVRIVAGDPSYTDSVYRINVESTLAVDATPTGGQRTFDRTITVSVTDGRLTVSNAGGSQNNKLMLIEVAPVSNASLLAARPVTATRSTALPTRGDWWSDVFEIADPSV